MGDCLIDLVTELDEYLMEVISFNHSYMFENIFHVQLVKAGLILGLFGSGQKFVNDRVSCKDSRILS